MYARIDELIAHLEGQLAAAVRSQNAATHQNRSERDSFVAFYEDRISLLRAVSHSAVFGRLDMEDRSRHYIGRIGLFTAEREQLLVDWRAPAAAAFYQATARAPLGVRRRRHLITSGRTVTGVDDDVLDASLLEQGADDHSDLQGEGALLAAVSHKRTGRMGDIVATIQAEQDRIIRSDARGVLVVQGGPGTGKTAVALHRAAYQLYTHRARLEHAGVLIVAPTRGFLTYIERVLPSLGETGVVLATPGELFPGLTATVHDEPETARVKGEHAMAKILKRAVRHRQIVPDHPQTVRVDGIDVTITPAIIRRARREARAAGRPHNRARTTFVRAALDQLVQEYADGIRRHGRTITEEDRPELISDLRHHHEIRVALNRAWLPYTPEAFLRSFLADESRVLKAGHGLLPTRALRTLVRPKSTPFTMEDVPLLDEIAELLGDDPAAAQREKKRQQAEQRDQVGYAQRVLEMMDSSGIVSAESLAAQVAQARDHRSLAERASEDRAWAYGHIVVDEAQELSAMMWRLLMRRNPTKSFTVVGDVAQTSSPAGAESWSRALSPFVEDRAVIEELTVNYRTPARIMEVANRVARAHDLAVTDVTSVREGEHDVRVLCVSDAELTDAFVAAELRAVREEVNGGTVAVIAPEARVPQLVDVLSADWTGSSEVRVGQGAEGIDVEIAVMSAREAKGLEFDGVLLVDPGSILTAHARGANDVFVAMTRPTQALTVLAGDQLPHGLIA